MKIKLIVISFVILVSSCKEYYKLNYDQEKQIYSLINDFIIDSLYKANGNVLSIEAIKFCDPKIIDNRPPPPPIIYCCYDNSLFDTLINSKIIDSIDLESFREQIFQNGHFFWDSTKLRIKTFSLEKINELYKKNGTISKLEYIKREYNANRFIILSTPLFSHDNEILITVNYRCGGLCGNGEIFVFKKINDRWVILYRKITWIS